jgi:DNA-binding CsgD family transcriptional regulator
MSMVAVARPGRFRDDQRAPRRPGYPDGAAATRAGEEPSHLERAIDILGEGVVLLTPTGQVQWMSARARERFATYFGPECAAADALPEPVTRWLRGPADPDASEAVRSRAPLVVTREGRQLVIRFLSRGAEALLALGERYASIPPDALRPLGLSRRETEVLAWVTEGKRNGEIATILGASNRTIDKHVERILQKLGVESRTAAASRAFAVLPI